jgi:hypothetical protein
MNTIYNFNPDEKRMRLAAMLQDQTTPYRRYKGPLGAPKNGEMLEIPKSVPRQKPAPIESIEVKPDFSGYKEKFRPRG